MTLEDLGWTCALAEAFEPLAREGCAAGRVAVGHARTCRLWTEAGDVLAEVSGRVRHEAREPSDVPVTGDWVAFRPRPGECRRTIRALLPRRSRLARKGAGAASGMQIVAANVDTLLVVMGLDGDYNTRRLERYLLMAWEGGVDPVVVLSKADLCPDVARRVEETARVAGAPALPVSATHGVGLEALDPYLGRGRTVAFAGSSGVGKSTLINRLLGADVLPTRPVRESDGRGRHSTTRREMVVLPSGALVIDTPGMRELQPWADTQALVGSFGEIDVLAQGCAFRDCAHDREPDCAVRRAAGEGTLDRGRLDSYRKLLAEQRHLARRQDVRAQLEEKRRWKAIHRAMKRERL